MQPLLIENLEELRSKLLNAKTPLDRYWKNYLELSSLNPIGEFQALPPLAWLITGEKRFEKNIRSVFLELMEMLPSADASVEAQFHSYPAGAPIARFAVYLDWIWDSEILSDAERDLLGARIIDAIYSHCYLRLKGRLPAGDNQQTSMAFACATVGYIFGKKRGSSMVAQKMFREGINRYYIILKSLNPGGWSGEGSTYQHYVTAPVLTLFTAFMEQVTGNNFFNMKLGKSTVREYLQLSADTINTAGTLPGWDEYGNCSPELKTYLVYLARKTGSSMPLEKILRLGMWSENEILAWYNDDKVWTLVFWPDEQPAIDITTKEKSWLNKNVCAKLISYNQQIDLLQMWDIIGAGMPSRAHLNPNNIELCINGIIHTVDGKGLEPDPDYFSVTSEKMFTDDDYQTACSQVKFWTTQAGENLSEHEIHQQAEKTFSEWPLNCAFSTLNAHSVVIVDDEGYRFSRKDFIGHGNGLVNLPSLKGVTGDVSEFYHDIWRVNTMRRSSLIINDSLVLIYDSFESDLPHKYTWQLMLRPEVEIDGFCVCQQLREGETLEIATTEDSEFSLTEIKGYPKIFEQKTHKIAFDKNCDKNGTLAVVMKPNAGRKIIRNINESWSICGGGNDLPASLFELPGTVDLRSEYIGTVYPEPFIWFGNKITLSDDEVENIDRISISKAQVDRLEVFVNGVRAENSFDDPYIKMDIPKHNKCDGRFWETHFNLKGLLKSGENEIAIASSEFRGQVISGPILLIKMLNRKKTKLKIVEQNNYLEILDGNKQWLVVPENQSSKTLQLPHNIITNAKRVVTGNDIYIFARVTKLEHPYFTINSNKKIDIEFNPKGLFLDLTGKESVKICIQSFKTKQEFMVDSDLAVMCHGNLPWNVFLKTGRKSPLFYYSQCITEISDIDEFYLIAHKPVINPEFFLSKYESGYHFVEDKNFRSQLNKSLNSDEWREQVCAVEQAGEHSCKWVIPDLIKLFEQEEATDIYATLNTNWPFSKMKITFNKYPDTDYPEYAKRRYRLKAVILEALGKLQAQEAEALIIRTLKKATDFYPVMVQACIAAERLNLKRALPFLDELADAFEKNTRKAAIQAANSIRNFIANDIKIRG
jgi:hypothetical protein